MTQRGLTLCPFIPGRPAVPGNPRAPWQERKRKAGSLEDTLTLDADPRRSPDTGNLGAGHTVLLT